MTFVIMTFVMSEKSQCVQRSANQNDLKYAKSARADFSANHQYVLRRQGCRKRGGRGAMARPPIKSGQGAKKGHIFLASFGLSAINQYFLVTLFPHIVNLPAHSNFSMRSQTVITTNCSEKNKLWKLSMIFLS